MENTDKIVLEGLEFYGFHGVSDAEQTIGHRYRVDTWLTVDTQKAGESDNLADTVDYGTVAQRIVEFGTGTQFRLLESLTSRLISLLLKEFPEVQAIRLRVQKIAPPMDAILASVGVDITRNRTKTN